MQLPRPPDLEDYSGAPRGVCAPESVWILAAVLSAYALAAAFPELRRFAAQAMGAGAFIFALWATLEVLEILPSGEGKSAGLARGARWGLFLSGIFFAAFSYFFLRIPANPYPDFAPREAALDARILDVSKGKNGSLYGTAEVLRSADLPRLAGHSIWFVVSDGKGGLRNPLKILPSAEVGFDGVVSPTGGVRYLSRGRVNQKSLDFDGYLEGKFVLYKIFAPSMGAKVLSPPSARFDFYAGIARYMDSSLSALPGFMSADSMPARTYRAMILGDKSLLTPEQKDAFARTGVMHVFAISGLHVGFAAGILYFALSALGVRRSFQPFAALPLLFLYVCACGGRPSAMRAFGMVAIVWLASLLGRGAKPIDSLVLAAIISLAIFPSDISDAGFSLSYCVAASIFVYSLPLFEFLSSRFAPRTLYGRFITSLYSKSRRRLFDFAVGGVCISFGCAVAAFPLTAHYFGYASLISALYSPLFVFGAGIAVSLGFAGFFLPDAIAQWLNAAACAVVKVMGEGAVKLDSSADVSVDFAVKSGLAAAIAALGFLFVSDICGRFGRRKIAFLLAPASMALLIAIYKIAS